MVGAEQDIVTTGTIGIIVATGADTETSR